jgi:hypothetical protein
MNTLQRNIDGYINGSDRTFSNEALTEMMDKARAAAATKRPKAATKVARKSSHTEAQTQNNYERKEFKDIRIMIVISRTQYNNNDNDRTRPRLDPRSETRWTRHFARVQSHVSRPR